MVGEDNKSTYRKANSFASMEGVGGADAELLARIQRVGTRLDLIDTPHRRSIVDRACRALSGERREDEPEFALLPHISEELRRVSDSELPRYLFYRYRYDVFPATRQADAFPPCVQIEPTSVCNYRCVFCYQTDSALTQGRHGHMGMMTLDTFKVVIDQIQGQVEAVSLASRGEPLLCKDIEPMLAYAAGKFLGLKINTNASLLDERKAHALLSAEPNTVVFSADAADPELYSRLRVNGRFEKVVENIRRFNEIRHKHYSQSKIITRVSGVSFSVDQHFEEVSQFWGEMVDQVAFVAYNPWENVYHQPPNGLTTPCSDLWRRAFVWWDGRVNPCDVDYLSQLSVGNILENSLGELWQGDKYQSLRRMHEGNSRHCLNPCSNCSVI